MILHNFSGQENLIDGYISDTVFLTVSGADCLFLAVNSKLILSNTVSMKTAEASGFGTTG